MKLTLVAKVLRVASDGEEILKFFNSDKRFQVNQDAISSLRDCFSITLSDLEGGSIEIEFSKSHPHLHLDSFYGDEEITKDFSVLTSQLFLRMTDLVEEINTGDLSKLQELADTFYLYEERVAQEWGPRDEWSGGQDANPGEDEE